MLGTNIIMEISSLRYIMVMERVFNVKQHYTLFCLRGGICSNSYMCTLILIKNGTLLLYHVPFFLAWLLCIRSKTNVCWYDRMAIPCSFQGHHIIGTLQIFVQFHDNWSNCSTSCNFVLALMVLLLPSFVVVQYKILFVDL